MKTLALLFLLLAVCPTAPPCPLHGNAGVYDHDEYPQGKHVKVFKCSWGHLFSVVC